MTDKKLTDNEIIKAFEVLDSWQQVALQNDDGTDTESPKLYEAIEIVRNEINRLQADLKGQKLLTMNWKDIADSLQVQEEQAHHYCKNVCEPKYKTEIKHLEEENKLLIDRNCELAEKGKKAIRIFVKSQKQAK